jgi:hypothetical protein
MSQPIRNNYVIHDSADPSTQKYPMIKLSCLSNELTFHEIHFMTHFHGKDLQILKWIGIIFQ